MSRAPALTPLSVCSLHSHPVCPPGRHLQRERNLADAGVDPAAGLGGPGGPGVQHHLQELRRRPRGVHALRGQRAVRPAPAGLDGASHLHQRPAGPHAVHLRDPGGERRHRPEPLLPAVCVSEHHHQPGW